MDLDDFFAKKDRKKSKGKKFATADEIAKKLEESGRRNEKLKKEKPNPEVDEQGNTVVQDEDEWREFEEEKKDYTGLKIQNTTLAEYGSSDEGGSGAEGDEEGEMEENEQGEMVPKKKSGPWRALQNPAQPEEEPAPEAPPQPPAPQQPQAYVPPSLRNANRTGASSTPYNSRLGHHKAIIPDVKSELAFPTLGSASTQDAVGTTVWSKSRKPNQEFGFEEARNSKSHSGRQVSAQTSVSLGNKYGALDTDQS